MKIPRLSLAVRQPEDVIPHLGKPSHWKQGRSAKAVADSWFHANGIPDRVRAVLTQSPVFANAELVDGWLERQTDLADGRSTPSQTDLMAVVGIGDTLAVVGIEAKVDESFGPFVADWIEGGGAGKGQRLDTLCNSLGLERKSVGDLRYQLFHRTAAVILEARRYRATKAAMIVQSFCPKSTGLYDYVAFAERIGFVGVGRNLLCGPVNLDGVDLWLGWVADVAREI